ncbi:MAG: hypothetical protein J7K63_00660, partial [Candidatus Marinimicrobia bacterium]|nr:hypothetical protein [Candidatus Neomarinimicrobiota bacterium]
MENKLDKHKTLFPFVKFSFQKPLKNENLILIQTLIRKIIYYGICIDDIKFVNTPKNEVTVSSIIRRVKRMTPHNIYRPSNSYILITDEDKNTNDNIFNINDNNIIEKLELFFRDRVYLKKDKKTNKSDEFLCLFENILKHSAKIVLFDSQYLKAII